MSGKYTLAQKRATEKHLKTLTSISIRIKKEEANRYKEGAKKCGMSLRQFVISALEDKLKTIES